MADMEKTFSCSPGPRHQLFDFLVKINSSDVADHTIYSCSDTLIVFVIVV